MGERLYMASMIADIGPRGVGDEAGNALTYRI
jgi:hypothetical protein